MPRVAKVVIWAVVFLICAAAGAWVASRTDPFPPGVEDPGARPTAEPSGTPEAPRPPVWEGSFTAPTEHRLHVGGSCRSEWTGSYRVLLLDDGSVEGIDGVATLEPGSARCDFEQDQLQSEVVTLSVSGTWEAKGERTWLRVRFRERGREPSGSLDVGGLLATIGVVRPEIGPVFDAPFDELGDVRRVRVPDGNQGVYEATYAFVASCHRGCP